ncbi:MAG: hypothetical protein IIC76_15500 [Bacteroidetes bacterium]|nr:hypothetical protein [Bacteroidota bacterium]
MKTLLSLFVSSLLLLISCSKEETKLESFNPEAFAYDLGGDWEVNAMVNVRGFEQRESSTKLYEASISYSADIITPEGETVKNLYSDKVNISLDEEIMDIPLEVQFDLDSTYSLGKYRIIISIVDNFSGDSVKSSAEFKLED